MLPETHTKIFYRNQNPQQYPVIKDFDTNETTIFKQFQVIANQVQNSKDLLYYEDSETDDLVFYNYNTFTEYQKIEKAMFNNESTEFAQVSKSGKYLYLVTSTKIIALDFMNFKCVHSIYNVKDVKKIVELDNYTLLECNHSDFQ